MPRIIKVSQAGYSDVYNMEVKKHHNFSIANGLIVHNCDALRYWCSRRQLSPQENAPARKDPFMRRSDSGEGEVGERYLLGGYGMG